MRETTTVVWGEAAATRSLRWGQSMSFATSTHRRGLERFLAILSALAVFMSLMVMFAPTALAHHPEISANKTCIDHKPLAHFDAISWNTDGTPGSAHAEFRIEVRAVDPLHSSVQPRSSSSMSTRRRWSKTSRSCPSPASAPSHYSALPSCGSDPGGIHQVCKMREES